MRSLPLFAATLALAPTGNSSRLELDAGVGSAGAGLTLFGHRSVDDDAPLSLHPYLQYAATLHVGGGGGGFRFTPDANTTFADNDSSNGHAEVSAAG